MGKFKMIATGHLGHDASVKILPGGVTAVINFSLACTERYRDKDGNMLTKTTWVDCAIWRKPDKTKIADYLKKGDLVYVVGQPDTRAWLNREKEPASSLQLRVEEIEFLNSKNGSQNNNSAPASTELVQTQTGVQMAETMPEGVVYPAQVEDDLPF
jgi:single-strand DNA-binding protein